MNYTIMGLYSTPSSKCPDTPTNPEMFKYINLQTQTVAHSPMT